MNKALGNPQTKTETPSSIPLDSELLALEERIMFDGAAAAEAADAAVDLSTVEDTPTADEKTDEGALLSAVGEMPQPEQKEIYFLDAAVQNSDELIAAAPQGAEIVLLDAATDGVEQIASVLENRTDVNAVHILAHGQEGQLVLGNTTLNTDSMVGKHSTAVTAIGQALAPDGDILIYGCDFTGGTAGLAAAEYLASKTGADIAASEDLTGHVDRGGDWILETEIGRIEAQSFAAEAWDGILAPPDVTVPDSALVTSEDVDLSITDVSVGDDDGDDLSVSLDVTSGTITLAQTTNLTVSGDGTGSVSLSGSVADLNDALFGLVYSPDSNFNGADTLVVAADDGDTVSSQSVGIQVASVNDAPTLTPANLSVDEGGNAALTEANFGVIDPDLDISLNTNPQQAKQLVFKLDAGNLPQEGNLFLNGAPLLGGSTFSLQDVQNGNLTYAHGGDNVAPGNTDDFSVTINDGGGSGDVGPTVITIDLLPVNQAPTIGGSPSVFEGQGTEDEFANPGTITESADIGAGLSISDRDDAAADSQITITNIDNANEGVLFWDADGDGDLDAGEALTGGETFAASELSNGRLRFAHDGDEVDSTNPRFDIEVTDAGGGAGSGAEQSSGPQTIDIVVTPNNDNPELVTNAPITVFATGPASVAIETANLQATDADTGTGGIVYEVTSVPTKGELRIDGEVLGVGARFTQEDIDAGRIDYNSTSTFNDGETDAFTFEVRDATLRAYNDPALEGADRNPDGSVTEHTFTIDLRGEKLIGTPPEPPAPGRSGTVEVDTDASTVDGVLVTEGDGVSGGVDTVTITSSELQINLQTVDGDGNTLNLPPEETVFRITAAPGNGTLFLDGAALGNYDTFTQADINAGDLTFVHDGSENHQDGFDFSVSAGTSAAYDYTFTLDAIPTNDAPSVATSSLPLLPEGATTRVTASQIGLGDVDTANEADEDGGSSDPNGEAVDDDLLFQITDLPDFGTLERYDGSVWVAVTTNDLLSSDLLNTIADGGISGLRYTHDGSENYSDSFSVQVRDDLTAPFDPLDTLSETGPSGVGPAAAGNLSGTGTVNVSLAPQNDPAISPVNEAGADVTITDRDGNEQTTANVPLFLPEGGSSIIGSSLLNSVDPDNTDPETLQYRLTETPQYGSLTLSGSQLGVGSTFTQADINTGRLNYEHDGSENFADNFQFIVSDSVADHVYAPGGSGGVSTFDIFVDPARNDPPELENAGNSTIDLFGTFTHDFGADLTIVDPDIDDGNVDGGVGETDFVQVTVALKDSSGGNADLSASGGITLGPLADPVGFSLIDGNDDDGTLVFQGTYAQIEDALTNLTVELENVDHNDTFTLDVTVDDRLRDSGGVLTSGANGGTANEDGSPISAANNTDTVSITFRASNDNDDPTIAAPGPQTVNEDSVLSIAGLSIDDVDAFDSVLTVDLSVNNGHLSVTGDATTGGPSNLTLTGTLDQINAQLAALTYIADENFHSPDGSDNFDDDTLTITVNDGGANGDGGGGDVTATVDIAINPVNDAPTVSVPGTQTLASGTFITFSGVNAPSVGDANDAGQTPFVDFQRVTVSIPTDAGTLNASGTPGLIDLDGSNEVLVLEGTLADINSELNGLTFTPTNSNADITIPITVEINDLANGGTELTDGVGDALIASDVFNVQISGVNDGPSVNALINQNVDEDSTLTFSSGNGNAFTISDTDDFGTVMVATVSVDYGVLTAASGSGATLAGDGTGSLTITGTESQINAALDGLDYTPDADFHTSGVAGDTITVSINDQGNTGTGGALSDTKTAEIGVTPVNDRPIASGGPEAVAVVGEDQTGAGETLASLLSGNFDDSTDDQTPDGGDTSTALSFVAIVGSTDYDAAQGAWQVSDGGGGWIDVPTSGLDASNALVVDASREIRFVPAADFHGTPGTLDVRLADGDPVDGIAASSSAGDLKDLSSEGGTGQTGRWSADAVTLQTSVSNENDPPSAMDAILAAINEDNTTPPGDTVSNLFSPAYDDSTDDQSGTTGGDDASSPLGGIAIVGSAADAANEGVWQYSTNNGTSWTSIPQGLNDDTSAILLPTSAQLRFVPVAEFNGTPGELGVRLADVPQLFSASTDISGVVGDDPSRDTDIWSVPVALTTSVIPVNDAPSANPSQNFTIGEDDGPQTVTGFMQAIDPGGGSDEAGQSVSFNVEGVSDGANFTATELFASAPTFTDATDIDNTIAFTASDILADGETETVTVTVSVTDDGGTANGGDDTGADQTFTITITGANDAPTTTGLGDQSSTDGETVSVDVSGSFSDVDATDTLAFSATGLPPGLSIDPVTGEISGTIDFDAATGGPYTVTVSATDSTDDGTPTGTSVDASFTWTVTNPAPVAVDDTDTTDEDTAISRPAAAGVIDPNDRDGAPDGDTLTVDQVNGVNGNVGSGVTGSDGGQFTIRPDGSYDFDPDGDFDDLAVGESRTTNVSYRVSDGEGGTDTATLTVTVTGANDAPTTTGLGDQSSTDGETVSVDVSGSFSDVDATDTLAFSATGLPPGLSIDPVTGEISGTIDFDAATGGPYTVTVTATDSTDDGTPTGTSVDASFTWTVTNPAPVAVDDTDTTDEDTAISRPAAAGVIDPNDSDGAPDGDTLTVDQVNGVSGNVGSGVTGSDGGQFTIRPDGSYDFDPDGDFDDLAVGESRTTSVSYRVSDGEGGTDTATLTVTVTGANDPPVGVNDTLPVTEDTPVSANVLGNDTDAENDPLTISAAEIDIDGNGSPDAIVLGVPTDLTNATGDPIGSITVNSNGIVSFTPAPNYTGPVPVLGYTPNDGTDDGTPATVTFGPIVPVDDPLTITGLEDGSTLGTDGSVLESDLADGTNAAGSGETLTASFVVSVADGVSSLSFNGTVVSEAALLAATPGAPVDVVTPLGTLSIIGYNDATGDVSYSYTLTDDTDHSGGPVVDDIALILTDDDGDTAVGTLSVAVIDDAPQANADTDEAINTAGNPSSVAIGNVVTGSAPGDPNTLDGVADAVGADDVTAPLTGVVAGNGTPLAVNVGAPVTGSFGTLTLDDDGGYSYVPDFADPAVAALTPGSSLTDVFTYEITDADGDTATTTLSISIFGTPAVLGLGDGGIAGTDGSVLESDLADGTNAAGTGDVLNGSFSLAAPNGVDRIFIDSNEIDEAALLNSGTTPITINTTLGALEINGFDQATGTVTYTYTLADNTDHSGGPITDDFLVTLRDDLGDSSSGQLSIAIVDDAPVAVADTASLGEDDASPVTGNVVTDNDTVGADETASPVTAVSAGNSTPTGGVGSGVVGSYGTVTLNNDGSYSYVLDTANTNVQGLQTGETLTEVFTYEITDGDGDSATATLTLTITGSNDPPVAVPDAVTTLEDRGVSGNVLPNDSDPDGDPLVVIAATVDVDGDGLDDPLVIGAATQLFNDLGEEIGTFTLAPDGTYTFAPARNYDGLVPQVSYTISDGEGGTASSTLDITIIPVADGVNTDDVNRETPFATIEREEQPRPPLIVDHIVDETANAVSDLYGTPDLLSDVNTTLGVDHPILTALNALQSLDGIAPLTVQNQEVFGGLAGDGPIVETVRTVGFDDLYNNDQIFNRDFPDGLADEKPMRLDAVVADNSLAGLVSVETQSGLVANFGLLKTATASALHISLSGEDGQALSIIRAKVDANDAQLADSADGSPAILIKDPMINTNWKLEIMLENGEFLAFGILLPGEVDMAEEALQVTEKPQSSFTASIDRIASDGDIKTAKLTQAMKWGER